MKFVKGQGKPAGSGRKKGSVNKKKIAKVADYLAERGINPAEEILALINGEDAEGKPLLWPSDRVKAWLDLLSYCQAKPKETDEAPNEGDEMLDDLSDEQLLRLVKTDGAV